MVSVSPLHFQYGCRIPVGKTGREVMTGKRLVEEGYDDPYKQDYFWIRCFNWTKVNINGLCITSALLVLVGLAALISIASWAYISMVTTGNQPIRKTDRTKLFTDKNDFKYMKDNDLIHELSAQTKTDNSIPEISSDPMSLAPVIPADIADLPTIGNSAAVPEAPFSLATADSAPDKPYIIPAQPNDLNLDLIDDSPHEGLGKSIDSDDRLLRKLEQDASPKKSRFEEGPASSPNSRQDIHIIDLTSDDTPRPHSSNQNTPMPELAGEKLPAMPSIGDIEPSHHVNKNQDVKLPIDLNIAKGPVNKPHVPKKGGRNPLNIENPDLIPMTLYRIHGAAKTGSVCLDGSVPAYYHRRGVGSSERLWIIHFNGGAWCFDAKACFERAHSSLGSTNKLPAAPPIIQGINSPDPTVNPDFHDWNLVWVVYCDGASFTGDQDRPMISESGETIYMRGKRVLNAIINDVLKNRNLKDAEALILTGSSAGSMTAIFQADYIASKFPKTIPVRVFSDAGFFIDTSSIGGKNLNEVFKEIYEMQNSSAGLNQDCVREVGIKKGWQCFYPAKAVNYVKTPIFVLNSLYDIWALMYFIGINCKFPIVRQQERKRRSLYKNHLFPRDSELEAPVDSEESKTYSLFLDRKRKRDISGFEIFPFFRSRPVYIENDVPHNTNEVPVEAATKKKTVPRPVEDAKKAKIVNIKFPEESPASQKDIIQGLIKSKIELSDVLSGLSNANVSSHEKNVTDSHSGDIINEMLKELKSKVSDEQYSFLSANIDATIQKGLDIPRKDTISHTKNGNSGKDVKTAYDDNTLQTIRLKILDYIEKNHLKNISTKGVFKGASNRNVIKRPAKRNKTRRSTSIAKEYINILRSDPPECTEKELLTAMLYRNLLIRATNNLIHNPKSARFLISCINHSSSLFDDTWTTLKVGGKTIQQAFGDWFFERDEKGNYDLVDCPYPCNPTCP